MIQIIIAEPYFLTFNIATLTSCSSLWTYKIKKLYEQMLREDKADTYKPTKNNTIRTILVDDVSFNDIF